jgi:hypothetical protein
MREVELWENAWWSPAGDGVGVGGSDGSGAGVGAVICPQCL